MSGRRWAAAVAGLAMAAALTACGDGDDASDADLSSADADRTPVGGTKDGELTGYSPDEETAYEEAIAAFERSIRVGSRVYREGEATPEARRSLAAVYTGEELDSEWESLRDMEAEGGYFVGTAEVVRSKPIRILVSDEAGTVDLRVCVDRRDVRVFQRGKGEVTPPEVKKRAAFKITLDRDSGGTWRVAGGEEIGTC